MAKKILLTGGSGTLGQALQNIADVIAPSIKELDITKLESCNKAIKKYNPDVIIHAAAFTDVSGAEKKRKKVWDINVHGTENMVRAADGRRFVYISTDYVFDGARGNYKETDTPNPVNYYALTKMIGEVIIKQYPNTLTIRTAFKPDGPWPYERAFMDQYASHEFVSDIAPALFKAATMTRLTGVIHIAGRRKSIYDLARRVSPNVGQLSRLDVPVTLPYDTSLNSALWKKISSTSKKQKK